MLKVVARCAGDKMSAVRRPGRTLRAGTLVTGMALLAACSATRVATGTTAALNEGATGEVTARSPSPKVRHTAGGARDCDAEQIECFSRCWNHKPPYPYTKGRNDHYQYCQSKCLNEYMQCQEENQREPRAFPTMADALDWLKRHRTEVAVGALVVVAGATFVVATGGGGALILVPLAI